MKGLGGSRGDKATVASIGSATLCTQSNRTHESLWGYRRDAVTVNSKGSDTFGSSATLGLQNSWSVSEVLGETRQRWLR